jgi:beta-galactosidase
LPVYLHGQLLAENVSRENASREINLAADALRPGKNVIAIVAAPSRGGRGNRGGGGRANFGAPGQIRVTTSPGDWKRSLFSGLAQVIVQSTGQPGEITLTAKSQGVTDGVLKIQAQPAPHRPAVAAN